MRIDISLVYYTFMRLNRFWFWLLVIGLGFIQTSVVRINWLLLVGLWLATADRWVEVWLAGLSLDLIQGTRLGMEAASLLGIGVGVKLLTQKLVVLNWWQWGLVIGGSDVIIKLITERSWQWQETGWLLAVSGLLSLARLKWLKSDKQLKLKLD